MRLFRHFSLLLVACSLSLPSLARAQIAPAPLAPAPAPAQAKFAIAMTLGRTLSSPVGSQGDAERADTLGLAFRFRVLGFETWVEVGKAEFQDTGRVDRRIGLSLYHRIGGDRLAPYLLLGSGLNVAAPIAGTDVRSDQVYGEIGGGLGYRLSDRLDLTADYAIGRRWYLGTRGDDVRLLYMMPSDQDENYRQVRFGVRVAF